MSDARQAVRSEALKLIKQELYYRTGERNRPGLVYLSTEDIKEIAFALSQSAEPKQPRDAATPQPAEAARHPEQSGAKQGNPFEETIATAYANALADSELDGTKDNRYELCADAIAKAYPAIIRDSIALNPAPRTGGPTS